ncbi:SpsE Sialic acid synthase [Candidatus Pelagibacterales bacterium]
MTVTIGKKKIGHGQPVYIISEIGINHNGDIDLCKKLIRISKEAGVDAVKFQKRTIDIVYSKDELDKFRESPFGKTNRDLKKALEFEKDQYEEIDKLCAELDLDWTCSCWDENSLVFLNKFNPKFIKIASASLTDKNLLKKHVEANVPIILSTGMSTMEQIEEALKILGTKNTILLHCTSTYPGKTEELNLKVIQTLKDKFNVPVGYSGHETGIATSVCAVALGACVIERHVTLDRSNWGSDQSASLEPNGLKRMVRDIREFELALGDGKKVIYDSERPIIDKLRRITDF